jgi:hypothetical protein
MQGIVRPSWFAQKVAVFPWRIENITIPFPSGLFQKMTSNTNVLT